MRVRMLVVAGAVLACIWVLPGTASADYVPADSGSLTVASDPGDYVGGGGSYAYSTSADTFITHGDAYFANGNMVNVQVRPADFPAEHWELSFRAPYGQVLQPGTYTNVVRDNGALATGAQPEMDISSFLGGCNTVTGSFTVISVSYGPYGYLQSLDATFEQHCEGATAALRGEIQVVTPQAPPAQQVQLTINPKGMVTRSNGLVFVQGLVSCPQTVAMPLSVNVSQAVKKGTLTGSGSAQVNCTPTPTAWTATIAPPPLTKFSQGPIQVQVSGTAFDPYYSQYLGVNPIYVTGTQSATVQVDPG